MLIQSKESVKFLHESWLVGSMGEFKHLSKALVEERVRERGPGTLRSFGFQLMTEQKVALSAILQSTSSHFTDEGPEAQ